jgi:hypothetical protein
MYLFNTLPSFKVVSDDAGIWLLYTPAICMAIWLLYTPAICIWMSRPNSALPQYQEESEETSNERHDVKEIVPALDPQTLLLTGTAGSLPGNKMARSWPLAVT